MKEKNTKGQTEASSKCKGQPVNLQIELPFWDVILQAEVEIEALAAQTGLKIIERILEAEIDHRCGSHGQQSAYRHGSQPGYVVFAGRKVNIQKPRVRAKGGGELTLETYKAFQQKGKMQGAVKRQLLHQVSTRNYRASIDTCLEGYGIDKSSVSRHWKEATAAEVQKLQQRPVPADLVVLFIDGQYYHKQCLVAALGVDKSGHKHVLGLWNGATETSAVVQSLLTDLRERGLNTSAAILVIIDGSKALYKGIKEVFGQAALIQRCRVHKLRNVLDHLPKEKRHQAAWRLRAAWAKNTMAEALKEMRLCVKWLEGINQGAAHSLEEGLEETLTVTGLGLDEKLLKSLRSTNLIESLYAQSQTCCRRVKHWKNGQMVLRWGATALLTAEKKFNRICGCNHLPQLIAVLQKHHSTLASSLQAA